MILSRRILFLLAMLTGFVVVPMETRAADPRSVGGMLAWPHDEMVRALGIFVPERMKADEVPGVAVAIVRDGAVIYAATFGKADKGSNAPVTPATLFEAGEIGETVASYAALGLMRDKLLFLDAPLARDLATPWLTSAEDSERVTLRHVLTHTSGLPDNLAHPARATRFAPGTRFLHSGVGFLYLRYAMETVGGKPFADLMEERVFAPFGMAASGYMLGAGERAHVARGYVPLSFPVFAFYLPFAVSSFFVLAIVWGIVRFALQRRIEPADLLWPLSAGLVFAVAVVWNGLGVAHAAFVIATSVGFALAVVFLGALIYYVFHVVGIVSSRDGVISRGRDTSEKTAFFYSLALAFAASLLCLDWLLGVPRFALLERGERPGAAGSFLTNAADMARFMVGYMEARELGPAMRARMLAERVDLDPPFAWGLGIGIRQDAPADRSGETPNETLWARGSTMGFESLMVMDPARRAGVVVLTNSREGGALAQEVARNALGLEGNWALP